MKDVTRRWRLAGIVPPVSASVHECMTKAIDRTTATRGGVGR